MAFVDSLRALFPDNVQLQADLRTLRTDRFSTLERFVDDRDVRERLGFHVGEDGRATWHFPIAQLEPLVETVVGFLARTKVQGVYHKTDRLTYLEQLGPRVPLPSQRLDKPIDTPPPAAKPAQAVDKAPRVRRTPTRLLEGLAIHNGTSRIRAIADEARSLNPESHPNATAVLIRLLVEMSLADVAKRQGWPEPESLPRRIRRALSVLDPNANDPGRADSRFEHVRRGLKDPESLMSAQTLQKLVHSEHFHPVPSDVRAWASNYTPFLQALDDLAKKP